MKSLKRLLIANRGEIAARIARTARLMGIEPIIIYSDADLVTLAVSEAKEAYRLGPARASESYLDAKKILALAREVQADAIHPGYGFLSENADFARAVNAAGLIWVGPPPEAMEQVSSKSRAKDLAEKSQVPILPGFRGEQNMDRFVKEAKRIGFPVLLKAAAGGGGRGIRLVTDASSLKAQFDQAHTEALNAFGDGELLLEKYVDKSRHIEIQIFGDSHGHVIHLGERDCSVQRRHQKLIEESPSPAVDAALREKMTSAALRLGQACGYAGAGTVEFLLTPSGEFYFLEVNARLQVEHPVTEMVTGLDLVEWQLRVARGEELPLAQDQIHFAGHAIQARLYAEDPYQNYRPQTGRVEQFSFPADARVDQFLVANAEITPYYDSMLAKIIVHTPERATAIPLLIRALDETLISGLTTNQIFLKQILASDFFTTGETFTQTLDSQTFTKPPTLWHDEARRLAALAHFLASTQRRADPLNGWSNSSNHAASTVWREGKDLKILNIVPTADGPRIDGQIYKSAEWIAPLLRVEGERALVHIQETVTDVLYHGEMHSFIDARARQTGAGPGSDPDAVISPMAGTLTKLLGEPKAQVKAGDVLAIVEAMKMQLELRAPRDGRIESIHATAGTQVKNKQILLRLTPVT